MKRENILLLENPLPNKFKTIVFTERNWALRYYPATVKLGTNTLLWKLSRNVFGNCL